MANETVYEKIEQWIEEFKKSDGVKALKGVFEIFSFLDSAYSFWVKIFFPDPNYSEIILQFLQEIWDGLHDIHADLAEADAQGLIDHYRNYTVLRDPAHLDELMQTSTQAREKLAIFINNWEARHAYRLTEIYNLIVPLDATILLQNAAHAQDKYDRGEVAQPPDWQGVHQAIVNDFNDAIDTNQKLLGPYCFKELPNIPCYRKSDGKLYEALNSDVINTQDFTYLTELVWQANERLRERTVEDYAEARIWFTIERANGCLISPSDSTRVACAPCNSQNSYNKLWRLEYERHDAARIVNHDGGCLAVTDLELSDKDRPVYLVPSKGNGSEYNYEVFMQEGNEIQHYWRSWQDGKWHKGQSFGENVQSTPAAFQNRAPGAEYNYEVFVREGNLIQHYWRSWQDGKWHKGQSFGEDVQSTPAAFQNRAPGAEYNYEVFVREGNLIQHYWRSWQDGKWHKGSSFGTNVISAPAVFQNRAFGNDFRHNYEIFVREANHITHYYRRWEDGKWHERGGFGETVQSAPAAFQNQAAESPYNYEIFVREQNRIQHYWYNLSDDQWNTGQSYGENVQSAPCAFQNMAAGEGHRFNYEIFVRDKNQIQHYWRSWRSGRWHKGQRFGENVQSAAVAFQNRDYRNGQSWRVWHQFNYPGTVAITLNYDFLPLGQDDWYTYTKHLSLGDRCRHGRADVEIGSSAYVPGESMRLVYRAANKTAKDKLISLRAHNGEYVCAEGGGGGEIVANRNEIATWETFELIDLTSGKVALRTHNGVFVCAEGGGGGEVLANRSRISLWETFDIINLGDNKVALRAHNGQYVCAEGGGGAEVVANRNNVGSWETFQMVDLKPDNKCAFQAHSGQYFCAEGGGGGEVVANRSEIARWETFSKIDLGNSRAVFSAYNGQYICAEGGGGRELVANRNKIGPWEIFEIVDMGNSKVALKAHNGQYICAEGGGGGEIVVNRNDIGSWETFNLILCN